MSVLVLSAPSYEHTAHGILRLCHGLLPQLFFISSCIAQIQNLIYLQHWNYSRWRLLFSSLVLSLVLSHLSPQGTRLEIDRYHFSGTCQSVNSFSVVHVEFGYGSYSSSIGGSSLSSSCSCSYSWFIREIPSQFEN